jgi:hypothetical protein
LLPYIQEAVREKYEYLTIKDDNDSNKIIIYRFSEGRPVELKVISNCLPEGHTVTMEILSIRSSSSSCSFTIKWEQVYKSITRNTHDKILKLHLIHKRDIIYDLYIE